MTKKDADQMRKEFQELADRQQDQLDKQGETLKEILLCLKGSESLNFEGVIPAQRKMEHNFKALDLKFENKMMAMEAKMQEQIDDFSAWKVKVDTYLSVIVSKPIRWLAVGTGVVFIAVYLYGKFGWDGVAKLFKFLNP